jgi:hypothetical protein
MCKYFCAALLLLAIASVGCNPVNGLVGEYSEKEGGPAVAKLEKGDKGYTLSVGTEGKWSGSVSMREATDSELRNLFKTDYEKLHPVGLCGTNGGFPILVHVEKDVETSGRKFKSGTLLVMNWLMSGDVYKK